MIGIGGIGMSGLAQILASRGIRISGSDTEASALTSHLQKKGIRVSIGHSAKNLGEAQKVIYSLAIPTSNPELREARARKIQIQSYPQAVGKLTRELFTIAICGTHGKSTITALVSKILIENQFDPTVLVGTKLKELNDQNFRVGKSKLFVLEACEYRRAFLNYCPSIIILHTLDPDHLDYYRDFDDYIKAFREFAGNLRHDGYFFANLDDDDVHRVLQALQEKKFPPYNTFTYATKYPSADFFLQGNKIIQKNARVGELNLKIPGAHNRMNALAAFSVCSVLGTAPSDIIRSLNRYEGAWRRFEIKGRVGRTTVIDDYAHHPAEIEATLQAARELYPKGKICVVFQPHQYNRTKNLLKEFGKSFALTDSVIIPDIYDVRDTDADRKVVTAEKLVAEIKKNHKDVRFGSGIGKTAGYLKKNSRKYDVIFTMGAGDVWKIGDELL